MENKNRKKIAPIVVTLLVVLYMLPIVGLAAQVAGVLGTSEEGAGIVPFLLLYAAIGGAIVVGVVTAMLQRLREIDGGEEEDAKKY